MTTSNTISPLYDLLRAHGSIVINKALVHAIGLHETIMFGELVSRFDYFADHGRLTEDGYFFNTVSDLQSATGLTDKQQRRAIVNLESAGLIRVYLRGTPAKRYFSVTDNMDKLCEYLQVGKGEMRKLKPENPQGNQICQKGVSSSANMEDQDLPIWKTNNTKVNNTKDNKEDHMSVSNTPYKEIIDYLNESADRDYNHAAKQNQKLIKARWNEGYSLDDFKKVIDNKVDEWKDDTEMDKYLRPVTLFAGKFDTYLNQRPKKKNDLGVTN